MAQTAARGEALIARRWLGLVFAIAALIGLAACSTTSQTAGSATGMLAAPVSPTPTPTSTGAAHATIEPTPTAEVSAMPFSVSSSAIAEGGSIPAQYTCQGRDVSPPLAWAGAPAGTAALALIVDDPDAGGWIHWLAYDLTGVSTGLAEGASGASAGSEGKNSWGGVGWRGPCPPSGTHRYVFRLLALSADLGLAAGADVAAVQRAAASVTLGEATLTGTYRKS